MRTGLQRHEAVIDERQEPAKAWPWLLTMLTPFAIALVFRVFPVDRHVVGGGAFLILLCYMLAGVFLKPRTTVWRAFVAGFLLLFFVFSSPFWAMHVATPASVEAPSAPVFSYSEAKANPAAFSAWWKFFVSEVVRTNAIVFKRDMQGRPDYQGIHPYQPIPGASTDFYQGKISINNQGYRGDDFSRQKGNVFRILTIGDSATFGQTLFSDSRTWSAALQDLIARDMQCSVPVQVVNGGVNGYNLRNGVDRIESDHPWLRPDMVLSYFGWNSMADLGVYPTPPPVPEVPPAGTGKVDEVMFHARRAIASLGSDVQGRLAGLLSFDAGDRAPESEMAQVHKGSLYQQYQQLVAQSRRLQYRLVLLSFNTAVVPDSAEAAKRFYQEPWPNVRTIIKQVELHNFMIRELAAQEGADVHYVDTGEGLLGRYDKDLYLDVVHFTTRGDALMAANVYRGLRPLLLGDKTLGCRLKP